MEDAAKTRGLERSELNLQSFRPAAAYWLDRCIFFAILLVLAGTALPYGTVEPWWQGTFECAIFALSAVWLIQGYLAGAWRPRGLRLFLPLLALTVYALCQTISVSSLDNLPGTALSIPNTISADPYETGLFALRLLSLTAAGFLTARFVIGHQRTRILINVIIAIAVASAFFGIVRQTMQHDLGFLLPLLEKSSGYGQFINKNHFAYLMEMGLGLVAGSIICARQSRDRILFFYAALVPILTALILCNSRGGILSMAGELVFIIILAPYVRGSGQNQRKEKAQSRIRKLAGSLLVRIALAIIFVAALAVAVVWMGGEPLVKNFQAAGGELASRREGSRDGERRADIWGATLKMTRSNIVAGVGMGGYWAAIPRYHDASGRLMPQQAHNDYLELVASGGIIGIVIGLWFVFQFIRLTRDRLRFSPVSLRAAPFGAIIGIFGVAIHSFFDFGLHVTINALIFVSLLVTATEVPYNHLPEEV